jgi:hypothetical protein
MLLAGLTIIDIIKRVLGNADREKVGRRMQKAIPHIVETMTRNHKTPQEIGVKPCIRLALFRLWDSMMPGDIADQIRDRQDDDVIAIVQPAVTATTSLEEIVTKTKDAALDVTF